MLVAHLGLFARCQTMKNTNRGKDKEMDDGAITGLKTSKSWVSCKKPKKTQRLSAPEECIPDSRARVEERPETELLFGMVFFHTSNMKARLRRRLTRSWCFKVMNQLLKKLWSCATEMVVHKWKTLVSIRSFTGSQWRFFKTGLVFVSVTILTAVFCTSGRQHSSQPGSPHEQLLQQSSLGKINATATEITLFLVRNGCSFSGVSRWK